METWGFCGHCDRWFYIERSAAQDEILATCPVCATAPETLAERDGTQAHASGLRQTGA